MCVCTCISNKAHRAQIKLRSSLESHADKKHLVHAIKSNESQRRYAATSFFSLSWSHFFVKHPATNLQRHPSLLNKKNWKKKIFSRNSFFYSNRNLHTGIQSCRNYILLLLYCPLACFWCDFYLLTKTETQALNMNKTIRVVCSLVR